MSKFLLIAGHGHNLNNGTFDPGATGFIKKGEHNYFVEDLFPNMLAVMHKDDVLNTYFQTEYNVYSHNNIVSLTKKVGANVVIEFHFDATSNSNARGGHVIIYKDFKPDQLDLKIRDVIAKHVGLAYPTHMNEKGISGRNDLRNINNTANAGINYRLLELGFGTNKTDADIMVKDVKHIARSMVQAIYGRVKTETTKPTTNELYRVQVGAYANKDNAIKKEAELKKLGQDTYIVKY